MSMDAPVMYAVSTPPALLACRPTRYGEETGGTAGLLACQGILHSYLAAAGDDQFLVEQDLHEAAAPIGGPLPNSEHRI
jgi:hypothetical protein